MGGPVWVAAWPARLQHLPLGSPSATVPPGRRRHVQLAPFPWHPSSGCTLLPGEVQLGSPLRPRCPEGIPQGGASTPGEIREGYLWRKEPQSQICSQDESCMLGALNTEPGGSPPPAELASGRGSAWWSMAWALCQPTLDTGAAPVLPRPHRTQSPQAGVGPCSAPACCCLVSTPAVGLRNARFSDEEAENEASALISGRVKTS